MMFMCAGVCIVWVWANLCFWLYIKCYFSYIFLLPCIIYLLIGFYEHVDESLGSLKHGEFLELLTAGGLNKNRMTDNIQKHNNSINIPLSHTFISYLLLAFQKDLCLLEIVWLLFIYLPDFYLPLRGLFLHFIIYWSRSGAYWNWSLFHIFEIPFQAS
jgi:hypothetical protein